MKTTQIYRPGLSFLALCLTFLVCITGCNRNNDARQQARQTVQNSGVEPAGEVYVFDCETDFRFTVQVDSSAAWLYLPSDTVRLELSVSASGARYENDQYLLWNKGDSAVLEMDGQSYSNCSVNHKESTWQAAALRGVDFRAIGNEPGWHLELEYGKRLLFVTNYGRESYSFLTPDIHKPVQYPVQYDLSAGENRLRVEIREEPCTDSMSGDEFQLSVLVVINDQTLRGCGRSLP